MWTKPRYGELRADHQIGPHQVFAFTDCDHPIGEFFHALWVVTGQGAWDFVFRKDWGRGYDFWRSYRYYSRKYGGLRGFFVPEWRSYYSELREAGHDELNSALLAFAECVHQNVMGWL